MDNSIWALIIAIIFDIILFSIEFYIFSVYRQYRSKPIYLQIEQQIDLKVPVFSQSSTPLLQLMKNVWNVPYEQIADYCGLQGQLLLAFHLVITKSLAVMAFLGVCILIPIYILGNSDVQQQMSYLSIAHTIQQEQLMIAPFIFIVIFTLISFLTIFNYIKQVSDAQANSQELMMTLDKQTIEITKIPPTSLPSNAAVNILNELNNQFYGVLGVYVVPDITEAYKAKLKLDQVEYQLQRYQDYYKLKGERLQIRKNWKKIDAIDFFEEEVKTYQESVRQNLEKTQGRSAGIAYVLCQSPMVAYNIVDNFKGHKNALRSNQWKMRIAPAPFEINWQNFLQQKKYMWVIRLLLWVFFLILFFIFITPASLLQILMYIFQSLGFDEIFQGILGQYLPSLILLFYQSIIVRHTVIAIVKKEELLSKSDQTISEMRKYLLVMVTYTFLVPLLGIQFIGLFQESIQQEFDGARDYFSSNATFAGLFFTIFVLSLAFLKNGADFVQFPKLFRVKFRQTQALNQNQKLLAYQAYQFRWAYQYGVSLSAFIITIAFSVAYPLILVPGVLFFYGRYWTIKYNLLCFYSVDHTSTGNRIPQIVISSLIVAIFIFQLITCGLILLNPTFIFIIVCSVLLICSFIAFIFTFFNRKKIQQKMKQEFKNWNNSSEVESFLPDISSYFHPMQNKDEANPARNPY